MTAPAPPIFLSYRRADTGGYAGRLAESLDRRLGRGSVFHDLDTITPGSDFAHAIEAAIERSRVVLVMIGDTWISERDAGGERRLERADDYVRIEAAIALRRGKTVLPLLLEGARMPPESELPDDLKPLARHQALELSDTRWDHDVDRLVEVVRGLVGMRTAAASRRALLAALGLGAAAALGLAATVLMRPASANLSGRWLLGNGSFWTVAQQGERLTIEETHYASKEIWKRGSGTFAQGIVRFSLDTVFDRAPTESGELRLSQDGRKLSGEIRRADWTLARSVTLIRQ